MAKVDGVSTGLLRSFSCDRPLISSRPLPKSTHCALISHSRADGKGGERRRTGSGGGIGGRSAEEIVVDSKEEG